jgi:hypothetical protein
MLFFALLFIFTSAYGLIKGKLFYKEILESVKADIKKASGEINEVPKEVAVKLIMIMLYFSFYGIAQWIFIIKSLTIDPYLYPTLGVILFIFLSFLFNATKKSKDLTTEEGRARYLVSQSRKYTFSGMLNKLVYITYFGYMFAVLLKLVQ